MNDASVPDPPSPTDEPHLRPLIKDILRTRYCIPSSLFLLESLDPLLPTRSPARRALRLLLSDGELCLQALLTLDTHRYVDSGEVAPGCLVRLHSFELCEEEVGAGKRLVYLCVEDFTVVGWCEEYARAHGLERPEVMPGAPMESSSEARRGARASSKKTPVTDPQPEPRDQDSDSEDGFDPPVPASPKKPSKPPSPESPTDPPGSPVHNTPPRPLTAPVALPRDWTTPHNPLKLTPLTSIPHLPYRQNWSINTLSIISSLSPPQPSTFPPFTQRLARLADPSTTKRVQLTVFLDPDEFSPRVGSVVLLAGVKNHLFDGGSLKKYVSDRPRNGVPWWFEEPEFAWCAERVRELRAWWATQPEAHFDP